MPSDYAAFDVFVDNDDGTSTPVPSQTIKVYNVDGASALSDTASDADGHVAGATIAVAAGTKIRFSFSKTNGLCGYSEVLTT